jgi:hypothetical protein
MKTVVEKKIKIARTKTGSPCLWESLTNFDGMKRAIAIADKNGEIKKSIFIRTSGQKQCLIPITEGDYIVKVFSDEKGIATSLLEIIKISNTSNSADLKLIFRSSVDGMYGDSYENFINAIKLTEEKLEDNTKILSQLLK